MNLQLLGVLGSAGLCLGVAWPLGLQEYAIICLAVQVVAFIPAYALQTEAFYDLTGGQARDDHGLSCGRACGWP